MKPSLDKDGDRFGPAPVVMELRRLSVSVWEELGRVVSGAGTGWSSIKLWIELPTRNKRNQQMNHPINEARKSPDATL